MINSYDCFEKKLIFLNETTTFFIFTVRRVIFIIKTHRNTLDTRVEVCNSLILYCVISVGVPLNCANVYIDNGKLGSLNWFPVICCVVFAFCARVKPNTSMNIRKFRTLQSPLLGFNVYI